MKRLLSVLLASAMLFACTENEEAPVNVSIEFETQNISLEVGQQQNLVYTITPENYATPIFQSSDESVATVEDGVVTAVAKGTATINATVEGSNATAQCTVTVVDVTAKQITLNETELELLIGDEFQLEAAVEPEDAANKTITWESTDDAVASVSADGLVTAVATGNAIITATCGAATATCSVTVEAAGYAVGDFYDVDGVQGVVFEVESNGVHGKILSLDQSGAILWAVSGYGSYNTGAKSETDGKANTEKLVEIGISNFPAAEWCVNHGTGWYMPSIYEGEAWFAIMDQLNPTISEHGGTIISDSDYFWSSTEGLEDSTQALYFYASAFSDTGVSSYGDWKDYPEGDTYVRAIYAF